MDLATTLNTAPSYEQHQSKNHQPHHPRHHHHHHHHHHYKSQHPSAFHPVSMPSPPELLHDSEEDEEESMGSATPSLPHLGDFAPLPRKSAPHRSPPAVKDAIQASALDKSVVFQLDVRSHPFFPAATTSTTSKQRAPQQQSYDHKPTKCPDCNLANCYGIACTSRVICGESLLTALRKRVVEARSTSSNNHVKRRRMPIHRGRNMVRKTTHIDIPKSVGSRSLHYRNTTPVVDQDDKSYNDDDGHVQDNMVEDQEIHYSQPVQFLQSVQQEQHIRPIRHHRPWLEDEDDAEEKAVQEQHQKQEQEIPDAKPVQQKPRKRSKHETSPATSTKSSSAQHQQHHTSSGRPSRVKGPCQACQESSDGCMRKAFNWPFSTSSIYNDKGKNFVYLCNKCGLRYNKSGGCVCRHCRWVFCKEEKRKAMQHIEQMIRSRPDGKVDPDEDIENFVCTPKYWTCGRPWKVGWVLQNIVSTNSLVDDEDDDIHDPSGSFSPSMN